MTFEIAEKAERLEFKLWQIKHTGFAIETAIVEGSADASNYEGALSLLMDLLLDADKEAKSLVEEMFKILEEEKSRQPDNS